MLFSKHNHPSGYYVYVYLRDDYTPYYVGKGKGNRAWSKYKSENINLPKCSSRIVILHWDLTETWAFVLERQLIRWFGRKDNGTGMLRNLTDGGEGASGYRFTPEQKAKQRLGREKSESDRVISLLKYAAEAKGTKEWYDRYEKASQTIKTNSNWTDSQTRTRLENCKKGAETRRGKPLSQKKKESTKRTYLNKRLNDALVIFSEYDNGLNRRQISLKHGFSWDQVNIALSKRSEFEYHLRERIHEATDGRWIRPNSPSKRR